MPKKINLEKELESLQELPDKTPRFVGTRVSVACLRKLYQTCRRDGLDVGALVRQILEEQADLYLEARQPAQGPSVESLRSTAAAKLMLLFPAKIKELADKAAEGLAIDLLTLLQLIITEALPDWVMRASKAQRQRQQALEQLEGRQTPERATWDVYRCLAPTEWIPLFDRLHQLIEARIVRMELDGDAQLVLTLQSVTIGSTTSSDEGTTVLRVLADAGALRHEGSQEGPGGRWRLDRRSFLASTIPPTTPPARSRDPNFRALEM